MKVEILGKGCEKCRMLGKRVKEVIEELDREDIEIVEVKDVVEIMERGVMITPALAVDGEIKIAGKVPSKEEIKELLKIV
jgi:small redox-active disulfide protein 2